MDYAHPARPEVRLGNDDRAAAIAALATHQTDGRVTASEYSERAAAASTAQTWGDLAALFADLPLLPDGTPADIPGPAGPAPGIGGPGTAGIGSAGPTASEPSAAYGASGASRSNAGYPRGNVYGRDRARYDRRGRRPLGGRAGVAIVSAAPLLAVLLFFLTGFAWGFNWSWLWFLLVPLAGAIVYAPSWYDDHDDR